MIKLEQVTKRFNSKANQVIALNNVTLHIEKGEIFGIIGFSGAGKSTLIRCLNLLERPTMGRVTVAGQDLTALNEKGLREARREIGMIFQHFNLLSSRTVAENVAFPLEIAGLSGEEIKARVAEMLTLVGLEDKFASYPSQLSGGQKQRVGIARALASKPMVLLCDEATSALDPQTTDSILKLLKDINQQLGLTIVLITHEMNVIREICHRVAVIEEGGVIELGSVFDVFTSPRHPTTKEFVKSVINTGIPEEIKTRHLLDNSQVDSEIIRIFFQGESAGEPVISRIVKDYQVDINILYGNVDHIQETPFGILILQLMGSLEQRQKAREYLQNRGLRLEVISLGE